MIIEIGSVRSEFEHVLVQNAGAYEYNLANSIVVSMSLCAVGQSYHLDQVPLIVFYLDLKESIFDALVGQRGSRIKADYEDLFVLRPVEGGCAIGAMFPDGDPAEDARTDLLAVNDIRETIAYLESTIREILAEQREKILRIFESNQSKLLFDLLKIIDKSTSIDRSF